MSVGTPRARAPWPGGLRDALLAGVISFGAAAGVLGGFWVGRRAARDAFVDRVDTVLSLEGTSLVAAGSVPVSLFQAVQHGLDDPLLAETLARLYHVPPADRAALSTRLREVVWIPPYQPAPFIGHAGRPFIGDDLRVNMLGFRDERPTYVSKAARTIRVFLTGGSTAWGSGAPSQSQTLSYLLERRLNERLSSSTGYTYEVINTAFPAWSTTQEKILIQQRLADMYPDLVIMFSGTNDVHWALQGKDIRWFYTYMDQNFLTLLNQSYLTTGHPDWITVAPSSSRPVQCADVGRMAGRNVQEAASALERVEAGLVFVLQPNLMSTPKHLTPYERRLKASQNMPYWDACYEALRERVSELGGKNYRFLDLSRSFGQIAEEIPIFIDSYHFADQGNTLVADALVDQIDWRSIKPHQAISSEEQPLAIVSAEPTTWPAGRVFARGPDGLSVLRIVPNRANSNLTIVFDRAILPTINVGDAITASVPLSLYAREGEHKIYIADRVTGESSSPVIFRSRHP